MVVALEKKLSFLKTKKAKLKFLNTQYSAGNVEVAKAILDIDPENRVAKLEMEKAEKDGSVENLKYFGKKYIDQEVGYTHMTRSISEKVIDLGIPELADHAYNAMMTFDYGEKHSIWPWESAAEIAKAFGQEEKEKEAQDRFLDYAKKEFNSGSAADRHIEAGRFDDAIDIYLASGRQDDVERAMDLAREHVGDRLEETAQLVFDRGMKCPVYGYIDSAEVLGKTDVAKRKLIELVGETSNDKETWEYIDLVSSLVKLGYDQEAKKMVEGVAIHQSKLRSSGSEEYDFSRQDDLADLQVMVGDVKGARNSLLAYIDGAIENDWEASLYERRIDKGFELTQDNVFLERRLNVYEERQEFNQAAELAKKLGLDDKAKNYLEMMKVK